MTMAIMTKIGPAEHGRPLTLEEFEAGDYVEGYKYELIDGRLYASPLPDLPENSLEEWLGYKLRVYSHENPNVINYVSGKSRVFIPGRRRTTCPEPDLSAFADFPVDRPIRQRRWQDLHPILVVEVMTGDAWKDLGRNVELYLQSPSIREYWVLDGREDPDRPTLIQHRRRANRWVVREFAFGSTFSTRLLPGFRIVIDPRR
jgi:Uma2 family endonuclease